MLGSNRADVDLARARRRWWLRLARQGDGLHRAGNRREASCYRVLGVVCADIPHANAHRATNAATRMAILRELRRRSAVSRPPHGCLGKRHAYFTLQLAILRRATPRPRLRPIDRAVWVVASRVWSRWAESSKRTRGATVTQEPRDPARISFSSPQVLPLPGGPATTIARGRAIGSQPVSSVASESAVMSAGNSLETTFPLASMMPMRSSRVRAAWIRTDASSITRRSHSSSS